MDCELCRKLSDEYREGMISGDLKSQVDAHLEVCSGCTMIYNVESLAGRIIEKEKETIPDFYLTGRIMARIERNVIRNREPVLIRMLKPALIMTSLAAAIFAGVLIGNVYQPAGTKVPVELALINDAEIESVYILANE